LNEEVVKQFITHGGGRMPAFDYLAEGRQEAIIDFLFAKETPLSEDKEGEIGEDLQPYVFRGFQRFNDDEGYPELKITAVQS
jgi:quinoprotein glucose dehydrogenase